MDIPAGLAAESSLLRQNIALSVIKASAENEQKLAKIIDDSARNAPLSGTRGTNLNILV
jgi:hypothetical protein